MLSRKVASSFLRRINNPTVIQVAQEHHSKRHLAGREIVGWGVNGFPHYSDRFDYPFPAIRFKAIKGDLVKLKEKELGDWKNLTVEEKKALYRISFCQTFSEMEAPDGEWKSVVGGSLVLISVALWFYMFLKKYVINPLPQSMSEESRKAQMRRAIDLRMNPVTGIGSKWDYEKDDWKK